MPYGRPDTAAPPLAPLDGDGAPGVLPKIPGPWGEPPSVDAFEPLSRASERTHLAGGALNAAATAAALAWLVRHRDVARERPLAPAGAVVAGTFVADFVSGTLHWAFDTWFDEGVEPLRRMVYIVREHHMRPARIFQYRLRDEAGLLSWFGLALSAPLYAAAMAPGGRPTPARVACAAAGVTMTSEIVLMLEFHKYGHRLRRGRLARSLQRAGLLLSPEKHLQHHSGDHDTNYCLVTGIADQTLGRMGAFRAMERAVTRVTGAQPRRDDLQWSARYGRPR
ncbi:MAG TPA: fatty acid desaturase CarF family protein [Solirubrobacteraceae bacterium]|jgi:ubiquitin-conjugating enzyme E2 variant|nr:fatty acid desaturase CarF family protein [Solirubrobacteraceae bacterium]